MKAKGLGISASPGLRSFSFELVLSNRFKRYEDQSTFRSASCQNGSQNGSSRSSMESSIETITQMTESPRDERDQRDQREEEIGKEANHEASKGFASQSGSFEMSPGMPLGFNLGYQTASNPMVSNEDSYRAKTEIYPWRELLAAQSQSQGSSQSNSSLFAWGTDHTSHSQSPRKSEEESSARVARDEWQGFCTSLGHEL